MLKDRNSCLCQAGREETMKQAVIDIGSNSMRLSVYETTETGAFTILFKDKIMP